MNPIAEAAREALDGYHMRLDALHIEKWYSKTVKILEDVTISIYPKEFVALVGASGAGKSTLMNAYLGQKIAIVSNKPQTTRNQLLGILTLPDEDYPDVSPAQVIFVDTPGIH